MRWRAKSSAFALSSAVDLDWHDGVRDDVRWRILGAGTPRYADRTGGSDDDDESMSLSVDTGSGSSRESVVRPGNCGHVYTSRPCTVGVVVVVVVARAGINE